MKRVLLKFIVGASVMLIAGSTAYLVGRYHGEQRVYVLFEISAVEQLAGQLYMLDELDKGNISDVRRILQAGTGPQLELIIDHGDLSPGAASLEFRCKLFRQLKTYRDEHALFKTADWDYLWRVDGLKEAEARREAFLNKQAPTICNWNNGN